MTEHAVANVARVLVDYRVGPATMTATYASAEADVSEIIRRYRERVRGRGGRLAPEETADELRLQRALLSGGGHERPLEELRPSLRAVLNLQRDFASFYDLRARDAERHRARVALRIALPLLRRSWRRLELRAAACAASLVLEAACLGLGLTRRRPKA